MKTLILNIPGETLRIRAFKRHITVESVVSNPEAETPPERPRRSIFESAEIRRYDLAQYPVYRRGGWDFRTLERLTFDMRMRTR